MIWHGGRLREYRELFGWTQPELAEQLANLGAELHGFRRDPGERLVRAWERGEKRPGPYYRRLLCELFRAAPGELGLGPAVDDMTGYPEEDVRRRELLSGLAGGAAFAAAGGFPTPLSWLERGRRVGEADLDGMGRWLGFLRQTADHHGAGFAYGPTVYTAKQLRRTAERGRYDEITGRTLRETIAQVSRLAGWLAEDAGNHDDARAWGLEALHWARLAESDHASAVATVTIARQASEQGRPREAVDLAQAAQRAAKTPGLTSALLAREALGYAQLGDSRSTHARLRQAGVLAERARHDDWYGWSVSSATLPHHEAQAALALGDLEAAEDAARETVAADSPSRNRALYLTRLADVLVRRRKADEAVAVATEAADIAADLDSRLINAEIDGVAQQLARDRPDAKIVRRRLV